MGFTSCTNWNKKGDVVNDIKKDLNKTFNIIADKSTKSGYWAVIERKENSKRIIFFALIEKHGKDFYVKDLDESMGPMYYDCPLSFLDMVEPVNSEWAINWREKVRRFHVKKPKVNLSVGTKFTCYGKNYTAVAFNDVMNRWIVRDDETLVQYKLKPKQLREIEVRG